MTVSSDNLARAALENEPPSVELLSPAGEPDAAYAALEYGADAVYLGLRQYSARAEAHNFSFEELDEVCAFAHSLDPARRVFLTLNTLIQEQELRPVLDVLGTVDEIGVDAVIIQDLGVARLVRRHFPRLEMHASTQMAVHNLAGAKALRQLGFHRVTLARELTLEEVRRITAESGIETEVFIHGALCYSYSGLCLFSSHLYGRSGNRGKCAYPCREVYTFHPSLPAYAEGCEAQLSGAQQSPANGAKMPFSMKDLALPEEILPLVEAGVNCLKIEGRMKSPLFVACATDYYRRILDGSLTLAERKRLEADLRTIFSRPWTKLFVRSPEQKGTVDPNFGGHRGTFIGYAQQVFQNRRGENVLRFHTQRALELHDGLQIEIPGNVRPYGFAIDVLVVHGKSGTAQKRVFVADAGSIVDVGLPDDAPPIPPNARVFCASSQAVKRAYSFARPKPGMYRTRVPLSVRLDISPGSVTARGCLAAGQDTAVAAEVRLDGEFPLAKDASTMFHAAREAFLRLGDTAFSLAEIAVENPRGCFVPISQLNQLRRELAEQCQAHLTEQRAQRQEALAVAAACSTDGTISAPPSGPVRWSIKVDDPDSLSLFSQAELDQLEEAIVDIELLDSAELIPRLAVLAKRLSPEKIRLSLPVISRSWEEPGLWVKINTLRQHGYKRWQGANLSALTVLSIGGASHLRDLSDVDLTFDWPLGIMNSSAAASAREFGATRLTFSPEDNFDNLSRLLPGLGESVQVIVYQDSPLFISETCARAAASAKCEAMDIEPAVPQERACAQCAPFDLLSRNGSRFIVLRRSLRTIVLNAAPYCLAKRIDALIEAGARHLRADFIYRSYSAEEVVGVWRALQSGSAPCAAHEGNFDRVI